MNHPRRCAPISSQLCPALGGSLPLEWVADLQWNTHVEKAAMSYFFVAYFMHMREAYSVPRRHRHGSVDLVALPDTRQAVFYHLTPRHQSCCNGVVSKVRLRSDYIKVWQTSGHAQTLGS